MATRSPIAPPTAATLSMPERFHLLDVLRGVAALTVVLFHWQNFFVVGDVETVPYRGQAQPLYDWFRVFYERGYLAVDLFFSLSGFVFFALYGTRVAKHEVSAGQFFLWRFSRLFPLHLVTLLLAAAGQALFLASQGRYLAYSHNDLYHFLLHLPLLSSVGLEGGLGFNAPIWSVSVEAVLYLAFFVVCWLGWARPALVVLLALVGFLVIAPLYPPIGRGIASFFLGGGVFVAYRHLRASPHAGRWTAAIVALTVVLWLATLVAYSLLNLAKTPVLWRLDHHFATACLFPLTILAGALAEERLTRFGQAWSWLGDISYSSYLLHFPLQLVFALAVAQLGLSWKVFESGTTLLVFVLVLVPLALASHRWLEMPAQRAIRQRWARR